MLLKFDIDRPIGVAVIFLLHVDDKERVCHHICLMNERTLNVRILLPLYLIYRVIYEFLTFIKSKYIQDKFCGKWSVDKHSWTHTHMPRNRLWVCCKVATRWFGPKKKIEQTSNQNDRDSKVTITFWHIMRVLVKCNLLLATTTSTRNSTSNMQFRSQWLKIGKNFFTEHHWRNREGERERSEK